MITGLRVRKACFRAPMGTEAVDGGGADAGEASRGLEEGTTRAGRTRGGVRAGGCAPAWRVRFRLEPAAASFCLGGEDPWPRVFFAFAAF
jgi:hypothetical protein